MINAIMIDDEVHCLDTLGILINKYCPGVRILEQCMSAERGLDAAIKHKADLVFLDIEMPSMNGFEFLEHFDRIPFSVILRQPMTSMPLRQFDLVHWIIC